MAAPPYQKFFWGSYHKHTAHLRHAREHGAYMLLIGALWNNDGRLPADDDTLAGHAMLTVKEWAAMKAKLIRPNLFRVVRGKLVQDRVVEDLAKYKSTSGKRKAAGKTGGEASAGKRRENSQAIAIVLPTKPEPEPERGKEPSLPAGGAAKAKRKGPIPEGYPDDAAITEAKDLVEAAGVDVDAKAHAGRFRQHALAQDRRAADWSAAWRGWIEIEIGKAPPAPVKAGPPASWPGPPDVLAAVEAAFADPARGRAFLSGCTWRDLPSPAVVTANGFVAATLGREAGDALAESGIAIRHEAAA